MITVLLLFSGWACGIVLGLILGHEWFGSKRKKEDDQPAGPDWEPPQYKKPGRKTMWDR